VIEGCRRHLAFEDFLVERERRKWRSRKLALGELALNPGPSKKRKGAAPSGQTLPALGPADGGHRELISGRFESLSGEAELASWLRGWVVVDWILGWA
jgi:hypothetical protein